MEHENFFMIFNVIVLQIYNKVLNELSTLKKQHKDLLEQKIKLEEKVKL